MAACPFKSIVYFCFVGLLSLNSISDGENTLGKQDFLEI